MRFILNKDMRRRRLADKDKAGADGTFAYNMRSGKCIAKDDNDKSCGDVGGSGADGGGEGSFSALFAGLLALFAFY